jgi:cystine transport system permease protein
MSGFGNAALLYLNGTIEALFLLVASAVLSTLMGLVLAGADILGPRWGRWAIKTYSWLAQTTPPLILLFLAFYGSSAFNWQIGPMLAAVIAFTFFASAYYYEIFRASYEGVPPGQIEAARALAVPPLHLVGRVVLPQMLRIAAAPYIGRTTVLFKETSLASAISTAEIMSVTNGFIYSGGNPLLHVAVAGAIYCTINMALIRLERLLSHRYATR